MSVRVSVRECVSVSLCHIGYHPLSHPVSSPVSSGLIPCSCVCVCLCLFLCVCLCVYASHVNLLHFPYTTKSSGQCLEIDEQKSLLIEAISKTS